MSRTFELIDRRTGEVTFLGKPVTRRHPCPCCGRPTSKDVGWCLRDYQRGLTLCQWTQSKKRIGNAGWMHTDHHIDIAKLPAFDRRHKPAHEEPPPNFDDMVEKCLADGAAGVHVDRLALKLRVSVGSLQDFLCGYWREKFAWTFPMVNEKLQIIGVRVRSLDGSKYAVPGSRNGLFVPVHLPADGPIFVEEGPTSASALLDLKLAAIGRPSCTAAVDMTIDYLRTHHSGRPVVIVANCDEKNTRPDGSEFYPGQEGGATLAAALTAARINTRLILPAQGKDSRDWKAAGATHATVMFHANTAPPWGVK